MKIKYKLFISSLLIVAVFVLAGFIINTNVVKMDSAQSEFIKAEHINENAMDYEKGARAIQVGAYLYIHGNKEIGKQLITEGTDIMRESRNSLKGSLTDPAMLSDLSDIERFEEKVIEGSNNVIKTADNPSGQAALVEQNLNTLQGRVEALDLKLKDLVEGAHKNIERAAEGARTSADNTVKVTYIGIIGSMLVSLMLSFAMASLLTKPLRTLTETANKVSRGNIHEKVEISSRDEIGDLAESFKRMINAFKIMDALSREK